jgi:hypothetical protein
MRRRCTGRNKDGEACGAPPQRESGLCVAHDPAMADVLAEGRRLGGLRRRRDKTVSGAYDLEGLDGAEGARRILEIATIDTLGLENSISRSRVLLQAALAALRFVQHEGFEAASRVGPSEPTAFPDNPDAD